MSDEATNAADPRTSRRDVLRSLAGGGTVGFVSLAGCLSDGGQETPTESEHGTFVLSTVESGPYEIVGRNERRGFELAVEHLNEGGGLVDTGPFEELRGDGVLGQDVETIVVNTEADPDVARSQLLAHLEEGTATMLCGGVSGPVVSEHRSLAVEHGVPYMVGVSLLEALAGEQCAPEVYREMYTPRALMEALGPAMASEYGQSASFFQFHTDTPESVELKDAVAEYFFQSSTPDWQPRGSREVLSGSTSFSNGMERMIVERPNVVVLSMFGLDAVNAIEAAAVDLPEDIDVVVPFVDGSIASVTGDALSGVLGTVPWNTNVDSSLVEPYWQSYRQRYGAEGGETPTGAGVAHVTYTQTLQFAAAAQRAGSFDPTAVRTELDGETYDVGLGTETMQACNHQATRPVPVVRGRSERQENGSYFELRRLAGGVVGGCDTAPGSSCSM